MSRTLPSTWERLAEQAAPDPDRVNGPANSQSLLRLFGRSESELVVTLFRDHHAWCPYCQKIWLWLEEQRIPYRVRKVSMVCYGDKEGWYRQLVPSGMLPALELEGRLITESDHILAALEERFGPLQLSLRDPELQPLRELERRLFRAWCRWLCMSGPEVGEDQRSRDWFARLACTLEEVLSGSPGPFLLGELSVIDLVFAPFLERMNASLAYYKGYLLRERHPALDRWFSALEQRPSYQGTQSDFHTHSHDLPPQLGCCRANGTELQRHLADRIDQGPWPLESSNGRDPETCQTEPADAAAIALSRVLRHRQILIQRHDGPQQVQFDQALRCALTALVEGRPCPPPPGTAGALRSLAQRISVPRDMPLHSARRLRKALNDTALLDPLADDSPMVLLPQAHRRDQDPAPFLQARVPLAA